jgi:transposase-like protein
LISDVVIAAHQAPVMKWIKKFGSQVEEK